MFTLSRFHKPQFWLSIFKGKVGGKYLKRWQVTDPRTGKNKWVYKYKPISQRGAHEITKDRFRKVTKIADETHRAAVEKALQDGHSISMRILKDYPDLVQEYNKTAKVRNFDRISAKVKEAKQKVESAKQEPKQTDNEKISAKDIEHAFIHNSLNPSGSAKAMSDMHNTHISDMKNKIKDKEEFNQYATEYRKLFDNYVNARSLSFSQHITGGSKFDKKQSDKRYDSETQALQKLNDFSSKKLEEIDKENKSHNTDGQDKINKNIKAVQDYWNSIKPGDKVHDGFGHQVTVKNKYQNYVVSTDGTKITAEKSLGDLYKYLKMKLEPTKETDKPAFKLETESLPVDQRERNATQDLFPKKPTDKIVNQNYKPKASLKETTPQGLTTEVKDILLKEGMDSKAREFTDRAMRAKDSSEIMKIASEYVNIPKDASAKPSYNTELDKARKEKDPRTKWRNLKAILDKAKAENNVPEGLEQEVREAGKAMLNHALSGEWESKSPKKEINIDSMNPKRTK